MVTKDFTLSVDDANTVRRFLSRIKSIFKEVEIKFEGSDTSSRTNIEWVCLVGPTETVCEKTKNYITSLTTPSNKVIIKIPSWLESELSCNDSKLLKELERQSGAVIGIDSKCSQINIQGVDELTVVVAKSLVDEKLEAKQKSSENLTTGNDSIRIERQSSITEVCDGVKQFALKLGYDDNDIMDAAKKCSRNGNNVNENALLQELLKSNPHKLKEGLAQEDDNFFRDIARTVGEITSAQTTTTTSSSQSCETKRDIVIDGSNVAMCHGHKEVFSCTGIDIVVQWFRQRGHRNIVVFVPQWRQEASKADSPISNQDILTRLNKEKILVFTPSRRINGRRVVCYDDRYIVKYAFETDSVIVSNDNFRDLYKETPEWKPFLEQRLLMYSFVNDKFMPPDDPNGRWGPTLDEFLKMGSTIRNCPYKNKCTYGSKCRFYHPEKEMSSLNPDAGGPVLSEKNQPKFHSQPILQTSCAIENKMYDRSTPYQQEIIARGRTSVSDIVERGSEVYNPAPDWNSNQVNPTYSNSLYYQPSPTYRSQQPSVPGYYMSGHSSYTLPPRQQPSYHHIRQQTSYSVQENIYPTQTAHQQQSHRVQENSYLNQHTLYPSHQQSNFSVRQNQPPCHSYSTPRSHSQQFSVMPGYVDPRMLNHYYRTPSNMSVMHPVVIPVETALVQEAVGNREYLLRCDRYDSKNEVRFQKLLEMFPAKQQAIGKVLQEYPNEPNLNVLASFVVDY